MFSLRLTHYPRSLWIGEYFRGSLGVQNSGKSTLWEKIMWLFYGTKFESGGLPTNLRSFISAVTNHQVQLFDNIDSAKFDNERSDYPAFVDIMCKCSSGGKIQMAQLYENNVDKSYELRCDLFLTSRTNPFPSHRSDLLRRVQIFPIRPPQGNEYRTTESMKRALQADEAEIKLETLVRLRLILKALTANKGKEWPPISQMHSYETFTMRVANYEGWAEEMQTIWRGYYAEYQQRSAEDSPFINFIRCWLGSSSKNIKRWVRSGEVYKELTLAYDRSFTQTFRTSAVFGRRMKENISALSILGVEKKLLNGNWLFCFEPDPEQVRECANAYSDSLHRSSSGSWPRTECANMMQDEPEM